MGLSGHYCFKHLSFDHIFAIFLGGDRQTHFADAPLGALIAAAAGDNPVFYQKYPLNKGCVFDIRSDVRLTTL
jgi:hypothetical protein